jgi:hypothetical protein
MHKNLRTIMVIIPVLWSMTLRAQWTSQTISLQPGWNAVYLEVQPQPQDCDSLFTNMPIESVWGWNRRSSSVQFVQDPATLMPTQPDWLVYFPSTNQPAGTRTLFTLEGGKCYLIKRPDSSKQTTWIVQGRPNTRKTQWVPNSLNLVGFSVDKTNPPTFQAFFNSSPAHANNPVYRLNSNGTWGQVANLATAQMRNGEAFWIQCNGASAFQGLLALTIPQRTGLTYGRALLEQTIAIQNVSATARTVAISPLASASPPDTSFPPLAGAVPLSYWKLDPAHNVGGWFPLNGTLVQSNLAPNQTFQLRLSVRRPDMTPYLGSPDALYQTLLEVRDVGGSSRLVVPVSAQGLQLGSSALMQGQSGGKSGGPPLHGGLWVGSASVGRVSEPANASNPTLPTNTVNPFQFRLIAHVDGDGQVRLLQRILQMWQAGTYKPDPNDPTKQVVDQPGRFVLVTDESFIPTLPRLTGATLRDDQPIGRRFSTASFSFRAPQLMAGSGQFGVASNLFSCLVMLDYDDPLNPFTHKYHPEHDNFDGGFVTKLPEGIESFTVSRLVQLQFTDTDPDNLATAGWGDNQIGGIYRETITGLHKQPIYVQGTFRLNQASRVTSLNGNP